MNINQTEQLPSEVNQSANSDPIQLVDDIVLAQNIKENNSEASRSIEEIIRRHKKLCSMTANSYCANIANRYQDVMEDLPSIVSRAAQNYRNTEKMKFSTFLANNVKWTCLNMAKKEFRYVLEPESKVSPTGGIKGNHSIGGSNKFLSKSFDSFFDWANDHAEPSAIQEDKKDIDNVLANCDLAKFISSLDDERAIKIFNMRYFSLEKKNLSWRIISEAIGMSIQGCIDIHKKYSKILAEKIKKEQNTWT